ncbi:hypothetical protein [Methylocystis sp. SB2]|uniref:hypothetical protein n=1 Tax=Methylocystis sp. (strain SB2) TaxID=743836 RepID=UPI000424C915|nr:hypothetical protein [Methylocystis sp. SB2]ULO22951.1 hypothetical protein LNB28_12355 [Methylocystis sp. SB2]
MFVTIFDQAYADWGSMLLSSLMRFHPGDTVVVLGIDLSAETECAIARMHEIVAVRRLTLDEVGSGRAAKVANSRPLWLRDLKNEFSPDWMFLLDADLLFRRPVNDLIAASENHDVVLAMREGVYRGKTYRKLRVASGFVLFWRSGYGLIDSWCDMLSRTESIEDVRPWEWFWEQTCLLDAIEETEFDILKMPEKCLSSPRFEPDAWVWSANVPTSEKDAALKLFAAELMALHK